MNTNSAWRQIDLLYFTQVGLSQALESLSYGIAGLR